MYLREKFEEYNHKYAHVYRHARLIAALCPIGTLSHERLLSLSGGCR